jgi:hypothetical protein
MLGRWFENTEHVYSGPRPCDLTPNNSCYVSNTGTTDRSDVLEAGKLHLLRGSEWWRELNKKTDINKLMSFLAAEIFLSHWDGYGDFMRNNHYVHFDKSGKFTFIPWGTDQTFPWEKKHQLSWNASKPVYLTDSSERSTIINHCLDYAPCQDSLLQKGYRVSKIAKRIDLAGYSKRVMTQINRSLFSKNDTNQVELKTKTMEQDWISTYLNKSERSLTDFLRIRPPCRLSVKFETPFTNGTKIFAIVESLWEPGVSAEYQWFVGSRPIPDAKSRTFKITKQFLGKKLKLRITLKKDGVSNTVYFTSSHKVHSR